MDEAEYRKLAAIEDEMWYFRALHAHAERELERALSAEAPAAVLDAGCGTGGFIRRLESRHPRWRWTGVDLSQLACEFARARVGTGARIVEGSIAALPLGDASLDAVTSLDVIYHVDDDGAALREFFRVLRPGGSVVINVPAYAWLWSYHDEATHARRRYARFGLLAGMRAAGFVEARATYWNTLPFPLLVARRKLLPAPRGGSDVKVFPKPIEAMFNAAMAVERGWLDAFGRLPFGSSILAVARKPGR